jgi:hypothetical protein
MSGTSTKKPRRIFFDVQRQTQNGILNEHSFVRRPNPLVSEYCESTMQNLAGLKADSKMLIKRNEMDEDKPHPIVINKPELDLTPLH